MAAPQLVQADLRARALQRADMVNSDFVTTAELDYYLDSAWREFYGMCVSRFEGLFVAYGDITTTAGVWEYSLPSAFRKLKLIQLLRGDGKWDRSLRRSDWRDIETLAPQGMRGTPIHYVLFIDPIVARANRILLTPTPDAAYTLRVRYVPNVQLTDMLSSAASSIPAAWDEFIVLVAAIKMKDKEESDCWVLNQELQRLTDQIIRDLQPMDESEPAQVQVMPSLRTTNVGDYFDFEDRFDF